MGRINKRIKKNKKKENSNFKAYINKFERM